jgi:hypothetical protein
VVNLDRTAQPGAAQIVRAPRRRSDALLGYLLPVALVLGAAVALGGLLLGLGTGHALLGLAGGVAVGILIAFVLVVPAYSVAGARATRQGRDRTAGLPLAELSSDGVRVRYRGPTLRERRRGEPDEPAYDAGVPWAAVTGCHDATDPHGQPVIVLDVAEPAAVTLRSGDAATDRYIDALRAATGSPVAIRAPIAGDAQLAAVRKKLAEHGLR